MEIYFSTNQMKTTLFDDALKTGKSDAVHFEIGAPNESLFPISQIQKILSNEVSNKEKLSDALQYGPACGSDLFLNELAGFLKENGMKDVEAQNLILTSGATQSLVNIVQDFTKVGYTKILFEDPTYFLAKNLFSSEFEFIPVPQDKDGIQTHLIPSLINHEKKEIVNGKFPYLLYCVPTFNNPTGSILSEKRRIELVQLCYTYNIFVVCDDVYELLPFTTTSLPQRVFYYDLAYQKQNEKESFKGRIISNGSFSKICGPGLRVGWTESSGDILHKLRNSGTLLSAGCLNHFTSSFILLPLLQQRLLQSHLEQTRKILQERAETLYQQLIEKFKPLHADLQISQPQGGYFIWIKMPKVLNTFEWKTFCLERGVGFSPGSLFSPISSGSGHCLRICFGFYEKQDLIRGVDLLCQCFTSYHKSHNQ